VSIQDVLDGDRFALATLLSEIENDTQKGRQALNDLFPHTGQAHLIGVTGAPGTGKSTLVNRLASHYRHPPENQPPQTVAVVAVDPSSPFSGGAVLGDRVRMRDLAGDPGVFVRSMASRGSLGGLAKTTAGLVQAFDAAGFEVIFIETVGAGQGEVAIAHLAHTTLVIEAPGFGDDVQAIKAGILEIADILVVNKADRPGAENTFRVLRGMLELAPPEERFAPHHGERITLPPAAPDRSNAQADHRWKPPIVRTVATRSSGITELAAHIADHRAHLQTTGLWRQKEKNRLKSEMDALLQTSLVEQWRETISPDTYQTTLERLVARDISPQQAVQALISGEKP
jgi:LAO/AO transport system kinase